MLQFQENMSKSLILWKGHCGAAPFDCSLNILFLQHVGEDCE
jgi:hypothetical protein